MKSTKSRSQFLLLRKHLRWEEEEGEEGRSERTTGGKAGTKQRASLSDGRGDD